ncbi:MAG TPA: Sua5 family C-terminal domain-containing protein, partial [Bacillota bacterium]|nr:Sua5 family C-terminal domain-containing protein [Bacillota bacterium]
GMIHEQALLAVTGQLSLGGGASAAVLKSPGMLRKHYAPRARLAIWSWQDEADLQSQSAQCGVALDKRCVIAYRRIPSGAGFARVAVIPHDPEAFARAFYAELHQCDEAGAELIIVEKLPETGEWRALADRLSRAAAS